MGSYNNMVITTVGQALLTSVIGAQGTLTFSKFQTSSYQYSSGTDLSALTSLNNVQQTVTPSAAGVIDANNLYVSSSVDNDGLAAGYTAYTLGIFASDGNTEVLFGVSTADTPDIIPADTGGTPSTYTYRMQLAVSSTADITIEVETGAYALAEDLTDHINDMAYSANGVHGIKVVNNNGEYLLQFYDNGTWRNTKSDGHVIEDENGDTYPSRSILKILNSNITDDAENNTTIVEPLTGTIVVQKPTVSIGSYTYNGTAQGPTITWETGMDDYCTVSNATATGAGTYTLTIALNNTQHMVWNDLTTADLTYTYSISKASLTVPTVSGSFTYDGTQKTCTITGFDSDTMTKSGTESATNAGSYTVNFGLVDSSNYQYATTPSGTWSIAKATPTVSLSTSSASLSPSNTTATITVTKSTNEAGNVTASSSNTSICTTSVSGNMVTITRRKTKGSATVTISTQATSNWNAATPSSVSVTNVNVHVYGVSWDGTSTTSWTRTDASANFTDPVPYVAGASSYGSPFDNLQPWAGMTKSTRDGNVVVAIPKFWYKITQNGSGMKIQIADDAVSGYSVSPAHMDRGDGKGERDIVYIGRYLCNSSFKSKTGVAPVVNTTKSNARTGIEGTGNNAHLLSFATLFSIWLLYLVEFANWDSQAKIGVGCGTNSSNANTGYTDSMPYHTGTTLSSRSTAGFGTQYRNIEGLWDNQMELLDGLYGKGDGSFNIVLNPANYDTTTLGVNVGPLNISGVPSAFTVKNISGTFPLFIPSQSNGTTTTYACDGWSTNAATYVYYFGGRYNYNSSYLQDFGLFCMWSNTDTTTNGCRLEELTE